MLISECLDFYIFLFDTTCKLSSRGIICLGACWINAGIIKLADRDADLYLKLNDVERCFIQIMICCRNRSEILFNFICDTLQFGKFPLTTLYLTCPYTWHVHLKYEMNTNHIIITSTPWEYLLDICKFDRINVIILIAIQNDITWYMVRY